MHLQHNRGSCVVSMRKQRHWYQGLFFALFLTAFSSSVISSIVVFERPYFSASSTESFKVCLESSLLMMSTNSKKDSRSDLRPNLLYSRSDMEILIVRMLSVFIDYQ